MINDVSTLPFDINTERKLKIFATTNYHISHQIKQSLHLFNPRYSSTLDELAWKGEKKI